MNQITNNTYGNDEEMLDVDRISPKKKAVPQGVTMDNPKSPDGWKNKLEREAEYFMKL